MSGLRPFHLAFPVHDLAAARAFYRDVLGCGEGRSSEHWIDFDLYGHQIVAHLDAKMIARLIQNAVDGHDVPVPHFGIILTMEQWEDLAARLKAAGVAFGIEPYVRFKGRSVNRRRCFSPIPAAMRWSSRPLPMMGNCLRASQNSIVPTFRSCRAKSRRP